MPMSGGTESGPMQPALPGADRRRILVVEDDQEILGTLSGLLEEEGYDVQSVGDGRGALARLRRGPVPELIILDLMMPGMDGWEFRTIQRADPQLADIPVVAISADTSAKAAAIDATRFLRKPFRFTELLEVVRKIISDREQRRIRARLAEAERLASLGTLAAGAAHEIANPLSFTVANLGTIDEQLARMGQLIDQLPRGGGEPDATVVKGLQTTLDDVRDLLADGRVGAERVTGDSVVVEVEDSGEGIAPETRARLFEPFFTTKPGRVGTGLGLSICQSVLIEHAGSIDVESELGRGSLFRVVLPV